MATPNLSAAQQKPAVNPTPLTDSGEPAARDYHFEVISIRPGPPDGRLAAPPGPSFTPGHFREEVTSIWGLAFIAFQKKQGFELDGPQWMYKTYFTVNATVPEGATKADLPTMVRHLLEDRFQLKYHHVTRQVAGYELIVARSGAKVVKAEGSISDSLSLSGPGFNISKVGEVEFAKDTPSMSGCGGVGCWYHGHHRTMQALAADLAGRLETPVVDATGLQGGYDYTVMFTDEFVYTPTGRVPVTDMPNAPQEYPLLRDAIKQQLGLELRPVKNLSLDVVVLDTASKEPTEN